MKRIVVGASSSGIYLSLLLKEKYPNDELILIEKEKKLARKLYATGNGHCNILAKEFTSNSYNNPEFVESLLKRFDYQTLERTLNRFGVLLTEVKGGIYPLSYSASTLVSILEHALKNAKVEVHTEERVLDYEVGDKITLQTNKRSYICDELFFATGGQSSPNLGSDGSLFSVFAKHGYDIAPLKAGLCPIKIKEKLPKLDGVRHSAKVSILEGRKPIFSEEGEVLFRKGGLSGICVFNVASYLARHDYEEATLSIDFFPDIDNLDMQDKLFEGRKIIGKPFLYSFFERPLAEYLLSKSSFNYDRPDKEDFIRLAHLIKDLRLTYIGGEGFNNSQVTIGGVKLDNLDSQLFSKHEKGVGFVGETLDIDGFCGGYNLTWCLLSCLQLVS